MRTLLTALSILGLAAGVGRADEPWMPNPHSEALRREARMQVAGGAAVIAVGATSLLGGAALAFNGVHLVGSVIPDCRSKGDCAHFENDAGQLAGGIATMVVGAASLAGGIPLLAAGQKNLKRADLRVSLSGATLHF